MDKEFRAALEEQINENRMNSPLVTIDVRARNPETGEDIGEHREGEGIITLVSEGISLAEGDKGVTLKSSILIVGGLSNAAAKRMVLNLINRIDEEHFTGFKRDITTTLALEGIMGALGRGFNPSESDDED